MRAPFLVLPALLLPAVARAQTQGWGDIGKQEPQEFSWTQPLFGGFWMAWTPATLAFFAFVFGLHLPRLDRPGRPDALVAPGLRHSVDRVRVPHRLSEYGEPLGGSHQRLRKGDRR